MGLFSCLVVAFRFSVLAIFLIATFISTTVVKPIQALEKSMKGAVENNMDPN